MPDNDEEPTLSQVHGDLVGRMQLDSRVRNLEVNHATLAATMNEVKSTLPQMEERLSKRIDDSKVNLWPAVVAICAVITVVLVVAGFATGAV